VLADRVRETTTTTGTGDITLAGAATGFVTFNTAFGTNVPVNYVVASSGGAEFEEGTGYLSGSTALVRERIHRSSNSNNAVNFSSGTKDVFCAPFARDLSTLGIACALRMALR
jgi:hypothetical protein